MRIRGWKKHKAGSSPPEYSSAGTYSEGFAFQQPKLPDASAFAECVANFGLIVYRCPADLRCEVVKNTQLLKTGESRVAGDD